MSVSTFIDRYIVGRPHRFVPFAIFISLTIYFVLNPFNPIHTHYLRDPDDYMRLIQTTDWMKGQGWYDLSQARLAPGTHTVIHWARLLDIPFAIIMWPLLAVWGHSAADYRDAALVASMIEPLLLLALLIAVVSFMTRPFLGRGDANLAAVAMPLISPLIYNFTPGRADHHNYDVLIAGLGVGALPCIILCRGGWRASIVAGAAYALGFWISPEILPPVIVFLACLALFAAWRGGYALRNAAVFGVAFVVSTAALIPAALPVAQWGDRTISWFSTGYLIFTGLVAAAFLLVWIVGRLTNNKFIRVGLMVATCLWAAGLFFYFVPNALAGPFADYDDFNATTAIADIAEAQPILHFLKMKPGDSFITPIIGFIHYLLLETLGLVICVFAFFHAAPRRRMMWSMYGFSLAGTLLLAIFVEYRVLWFPQIYLIPPLSYFIWRAWGGFEGRWGLLQRIRAAFFGFIMLGPVLIPVWRRCDGFAAWTPLRRYKAAILAFILFSPLPIYMFGLVHGSVGATRHCDPIAMGAYIDNLTKPGDPPLTILADPDVGPYLLFRTSADVIAGNFNVAGNEDVYNFFRSHGDKKPLAILRKWHPDYVLICNALPGTYIDPKDGYFTPDGGHVVNDSRHAMLAEKMVVHDEHDWLKPVVIPESEDYFLFKPEIPDEPTRTP